MSLDNKIDHQEFLDISKEVKQLSALKTEIRDSFGKFWESSIETVSKDNIKNMYDKITDKASLARFGIKSLDNLNKFQKIAIVQSFLINCCNLWKLGAWSFYSWKLKTVDWEFGVNTALAIRKALIDKHYFDEKWTDGKPKNKFDGKITDSIISKLLEEVKPVVVDKVPVVVDKIPVVVDKVPVVVDNIPVVVDKVPVVVDKAPVDVDKVPVVVDKAEIPEWIKNQLHKLWLTKKWKFDPDRYEWLSLSLDGKKLVYKNEKNETKEYNILKVSKEWRKHIKLDDKTTIEKEKTWLGKKLESIFKKSDWTDRNLVKIVKNTWEIVARWAKKTWEAIKKWVDNTTKATEKVVNKIDEAKEKEQNEKFDIKLKKFWLDLNTYNEIIKDITANPKLINEKYQRKYMYEFSPDNKKDITNKTIKKDWDNILINVAEWSDANWNITTHTITIDKDKNISIK